MPTGYHHDFEDFGDKVLRGPGMVAHLEGIVGRAGEIAVNTAPERTGRFKDSFVVGTAIEDHDGLRAIGFLSSTDPDAVVIEFENGRTMNDAMSQAVET